MKEKNVTVNIKQGTFITQQGTFITKLGYHIKAGILEAEKELSLIALALAEQRFELQTTYYSFDNFFL